MRTMLVVLCGVVVSVPVTAPAVTERAMSAQQGIGIKTGDTVTVGTAFGWVTAIVLAGTGHDFRVRLVNGPEAQKSYPRELRRTGPLTAYDRANGVYGIDDRVQVLYEGAWVDSRVISSIGMEYEVTLPGNMKGWARHDQMRFVSGPQPKVNVAELPAPEGMTSCAGKIEGRYELTNGMPMGMVFRAGRVTLREGGQAAGEGRCWTGKGRIVLRLDGEEQDMEIEINDDGTLQTPLGEMRKRAS